MKRKNRPLPAPVVDEPPQGWQRRFLATDPRLSEACEAYRELSLEVVLVCALKDRVSDQDCRECLEGTYVIYTRKARDSRPG